MRRIINNIKNHSNWFAYYIHKYIKSESKEFVFKCRGGISITIPLRMMQTYKECFFDETYLKELPKKVYSGNLNTVIDIGANVGYFSLFIFSKNKNAKIFAYEPMPMNYRLLNQYKEENTDLDFTITNKAVSSTEQKSIVLNYDKEDSFTTAASIFEKTTQKDSIEVLTTSLEAIIQDNNIEHVDLLKLDCEGSEYGILYELTPAVIEKISIVSIETHLGKGVDENTEALVKFLRKNMFTVVVKKDIVWGWRTYTTN